MQRRERAEKTRARHEDNPGQPRRFTSNGALDVRGASGAPGVEEQGQPRV